MWLEAGSRNIAGVRTGLELQLLTEAVLRGLAGGAVGILTSWAGASGASELLAWPISISARALTVAIVCSAVVGLAAGLYPARRAAALDPIDALRHE